MNYNPITTNNNNLIRAIVQVYISQAEGILNYQDIRDELTDDYPETKPEVLDRGARVVVAALDAMFSETY